MSEHFVISRSIGGVAISFCGIEGDLYSEGFAAGGGDVETFCRVFRSIASPGMVSLDIGANIGVTVALMSAVCPDSTVIAVEPSSRAFQCLRATAALNRGRTSFHCLNMGIGGTDGTATFVQDNASLAASFFSSDLDGEAVRIRTIDSLAAELNLERLDFIKIDVEGFEPNVLAGFSEARSFRPLVYMEFNSWALAASGVAQMPFLKQIVDEFGQFAYLDRRTGSPVCAKSVADARTFLHDNMVRNGCVDDIVFSADPQKVERAWSEPRRPPTHTEAKATHSGA